MELLGTAGVGFVVAMSWILMKWRAHVQLDRKLEELLIVSDSMNRTEGRRAYKILNRDATIGDIIRDLPPVESRADTHPY
jgi:hypothetical protein